MNEKTPLEIVPWPAQSILNYRKIDDGNWGYLIIYEDLTYHFDQENIPTNAEIMARWGSRFTTEKSA